MTLDRLALTSVPKMLALHVVVQGKDQLLANSFPTVTKSSNTASDDYCGNAGEIAHSR